MKNKNLSKCSLTDDAMEKLFGSTAKQYMAKEYLIDKRIVLIVKEQRLADLIMGHVQSFHHLKKIDLSHNQFGENGLGFLVKAVSGSPIACLHMSFCKFRSISHLRGLVECKQLRTLDISGNRIKLVDAAILSYLLIESPKLRDFSLSNCGIDDDILEAVSPALSKNRTVRYLHLYDDIIKNRGFIALCKAVFDPSSFKSMMDSNHHVLKIITGGGFGSNLLHLCQVNLDLFREETKDGELIKYLHHLNESETNHVMPMLELDVKLLPNVISRVNEIDHRMGDSEMKRNAVYKILSNIDKIQAAKKIYNLQAINKELVASNEKLNDENSDLRTQLAKLKTAQAITPDESIADRVKRKRCTSRGN